MTENRRTEHVPGRDADGRRPVTCMPEKSATVTSAATVPAAGFAVGARAAGSQAGLVAAKCNPGAESVSGTFMRGLDMLRAPVTASGA